MCSASRDLSASACSGLASLCLALALALWGCGEPLQAPGGEERGATVKRTPQLTDLELAQRLVGMVFQPEAGWNGLAFDPKLPSSTLIAWMKGTAKATFPKSYPNEVEFRAGDPLLTNVSDLGTLSDYSDSDSYSIGKYSWQLEAGLIGAICSWKEEEDGYYWDCSKNPKPRMSYCSATYLWANQTAATHIASLAEYENQRNQQTQVVAFATPIRYTNRPLAPTHITRDSARVFLYKQNDRVICADVIRPIIPFAARHPNSLYDAWHLSFDGATLAVIEQFSLDTMTSLTSASNLDVPQSINFHAKGTASMSNRCFFPGIGGDALFVTDLDLFPRQITHLTVGIPDGFGISPTPPKQTLPLNFLKLAVERRDALGALDRVWKDIDVHGRWNSSVTPKVRRATSPDPTTQAGLVAIQGAKDRPGCLSDFMTSLTLTDLYLFGGGLIAVAKDPSQPCIDHTLPPSKRSPHLDNDGCSAEENNPHGGYLERFAVVHFNPDHPFGDKQQGYELAETCEASQPDVTRPVKISCRPISAPASPLAR